MGIRDDEPMVESDCIRCVLCDHEFDSRLEMMESSFIPSQAIGEFKGPIDLKISPTPFSKGGPCLCEGKPF